MLSVSPHFRANHPAFAAHSAPPPAAAAAADDDADYVLALSPEWAAKLKPTIERLRARTDLERAVGDDLAAAAAALAATRPWRPRTPRPRRSPRRRPSRWSRRPQSRRRPHP